LGPDGQPWDPERRAKRQAERAAKVNAQPTTAVETTAAAPATETPATE